MKLPHFLVRFDTRAMLPVVLALIVVAVVVIAYIVYKRRGTGCRQDSDCPAGQACAGGACRTPPASCYQWAAWNPAVDKGTPSWLVGSQAKGRMVPVGAQVAGSWSLGGTVGDPTAGDYGQFYAMGDRPAAGDTLYGVKATGMCPAAFQSTTDPAKALRFHGTPVCWDFGGTSHVFTPYTGKACSDWRGMGTFRLVQDPSA